MKTIIRKFNRLDYKYRTMFIIVSIFNLISIGFITQGLLLLSNIETLLRILFLIFVYIGYLVYLFVSILMLFTRKNKLYITNSIFIFFISIVFIFVSVYINKTYGIVDNMTKEEITYSTSLVVLKDSSFKNNKNFKVGMISNEDDIEGNKLANKLIDKKNLDKISIEYYDNYLEMLGKLYSNEINGVFLNSNYVLNYNSYENYTNIGEETKIIYSYK